jgi:hypothetical protein
LLDRIEQRKMPAPQPELLARWLDTAPEVPEGEWFKRFSGMTVCGEGEFVKTSLLPGQRPKGERVGERRGESYFISRISCSREAWS